MRKRRGQKCIYCGRWKPRREFYPHRLKKNGLSSGCKTCHRRNSKDIHKFGHQVWNKKRMLPRTKTLLTIKKEVKTKEYMDTAIDRLAYMIADAIVRKKYGLPKAGEGE